MKLPKNVFGINGKEAYRRILESDNSNEKEPESNISIIPFNVDNPKKWIILNDEYLISIDKFYHGKNNWYEMHKLLQGNNQLMPNLLDSNKFDQILWRGVNEKHSKAYYADGTIVPSEQLEQIYNERHEVRSPWRAEYLDARFEKGKGGLYIFYNHIVQSDGSLKPQDEEILKDTLMESKTPGINLEEWIKNPNKHGLPKSNISNGDFYYWSPQKEAVARLVANSDWAFLYCDRFPSFSDDGLGVRAKILRK